MKNAYLLYDFFFLYRLFALQNNVSVMWCILTNSYSLVTFNSVGIW